MVKAERSPSELASGPKGLRRSKRGYLSSLPPPAALSRAYLRSSSCSKPDSSSRAFQENLEQSRHS